MLPAIGGAAVPTPSRSLAGEETPVAEVERHAPELLEEVVADEALCVFSAARL